MKNYKAFLIKKTYHEKKVSLLRSFICLIPFILSPGHSFASSLIDRKACLDDYGKSVDYYSNAVDTINSSGSASEINALLMGLKLSALQQEQSCRKALDRKTVSVAYEYISFAAYELGDPIESRFYAEKCVAEYYFNSQCYGYLSQAFRKIGQFKESRQAASKGVEIANFLVNKLSSDLHNTIIRISSENNMLNRMSMDLEIQSIQLEIRMSKATIVFIDNRGLRD
jgi:hypothetical protein